MFTNVGTKNWTNLLSHPSQVSEEWFCGSSGHPGRSCYCKDGRFVSSKNRQIGRTDKPSSCCNTLSKWHLVSARALVCVLRWLGRFATISVDPILLEPPCSHTWAASQLLSWTLPGGPRAGFGALPWMKCSQQRQTDTRELSHEGILPYHGHPIPCQDESPVSPPLSHLIHYWNPVCHFAAALKGQMSVGCLCFLTSVKIN